LPRNVHADDHFGGHVEFDLQPTLTGDLLIVRPLAADDFDDLYRAASDPKIWEQHPEPDRHKREVFERFFDGRVVYAA
jgi:N-acetyltransferase